jgi:hypothetical protein
MEVRRRLVGFGHREQLGLAVEPSDKGEAHRSSRSMLRLAPKLCTVDP